MHPMFGTDATALALMKSPEWATVPLLRYHDFRHFGCGVNRQQLWCHHRRRQVFLLPSASPIPSPLLPFPRIPFHLPSPLSSTVVTGPRMAKTEPI
jgi:hypothetical protein